MAHELLGKVNEELSIDSAFEILDRVKQSGEQWKTELSIVFLSKEKEVYFSFDGDFNKRYKFSFNELTVKTDKGFSENKEMKLTSKGITKSDLKKSFGI